MSAGAAEGERRALGSGLVALLAVACGVSVANVYFAQPLLPQIGRTLGLSEAGLGLVVTVAQVGYLVGLLAVVPLGDLVDRRRLIPAQCVGAGLALALAAAAGGRVAFLAAVALAGMLSAVVQVIVAYVATMSPASQRGRNVGLVTSGVVMGILLGRVGAGAIADLLGWRAVYVVAAALSATLALALLVLLPAEAARTRGSYLRSVLSVVTLTRRSPRFRARASLTLLLFAAFAVLWNSVALPLSAAPWHLSAGQIGLFALAGVAGALGAARAGALSDRGHSRLVTGAALAILTVSWLAIGEASHSLVILVVGIILLDLAVQAVHVTSQNLIVAEDPASSSRIIGSYMAFYSVGSALGASASAAAYDAGGWSAVSVLGGGISAAALALWAWSERRAEVGVGVAVPPTPASAHPAPPRDRCPTAPARAGCSEVVGHS